MGRWEPDAQGRLQQAALELYGERGFEATTVAEIAERAGLTERTFFRYFADKREVLFAGGSILQELLLQGVADAPADASPLEIVAAALDHASTLFEDRRAHSTQRQAVIAANPELQERELIKLAMLASALADALRGRGVNDPTAALAAEAGIAVFKVSFERWTADPDGGELDALDPRLVRRAASRDRPLIAMASSPSRPVYRTSVRDSRRWDHLALRPGDIVVSTPPKSGTTWMQMICALLVHQTPVLPDSLDRLSPWLDALTRPLDAVVADLDAQHHRRVIKTHTPLDGLPIEPGVTYVTVARDPRDVAISWEHHRSNQDRIATHTAVAEATGSSPLVALGLEPRSPVGPTEGFWHWVDDPMSPYMAASTLAATAHHLETFWDGRHAEHVVLVHYDDLVRDLDGEMRRLARRLGIAVPESRWPALVEAATFERMRERADELAPNATESIWQDDRSFFHAGASGQWHDQLGPTDLARYRRRVDDLVESDLAQWLHQGEAG